MAAKRKKKARAKQAGKKKAGARARKAGAKKARRKGGAKRKAKKAGRKGAAKGRAKKAARPRASVKVTGPTRAPAAGGGPGTGGRATPPELVAGAPDTAVSLDERLSANFTLREFTRSQTASRRGIDNVPPPETLRAIRHLVETVLQPARTAFAQSMNINSGYRSPELNAAIGGSSTSQHVWTANYAAADIEIFGSDNLELAYWIRDNCDFDQLISECYVPSEGPNSGWVHVSSRVDGGNRRESLTYQRGEGYSPGLPAR